MRIAGIDPGLRSGGLVLIESDPERVLASVSLVEKPGDSKQARAEVESVAEALGGWADKQFASACLRAESWMERFAEAFERLAEQNGEIAMIACESFVDQPSKARKEKAGLLARRWQTPLLTGFLVPYLAARGYTVANGRLVFQNAGVVIPQMRSELAILENGRAPDKEAVVPGGSLVGNDHERKALAHALALAIRVRRHRPELAVQAVNRTYVRTPDE